MLRSSLAWVAVYVAVVAPAMLTPWLAARRDRNVLAWALLALFLGPIAFMVLSLLPRSRPTVLTYQVSMEEEARGYADPSFSKAPSVRVAGGLLLLGALMTGAVAFGLTRTTDVKRLWDPRFHRFSVRQIKARVLQEVLGLRRADGLTYGEFVSERIRRACPRLGASDIAFVAEEAVVAPDYVLWTVSPNYTHGSREVCDSQVSTAAPTNPVGSLRSDEGRVRGILGRVIEPVGGSFHSWLDDFTSNYPP